jgi:hypothetical protein
VGSRLGVSTEKIEALNDYAKSPLFSDAEKAALAWENSSSRFNRAFRIPSQGFWKP